MDAIVITPQSTFHEETAEPKTASLPLAHLSIELGHLYTEDYAVDDVELAAYFRRIARRAEAVRDIGGAELAPAKPRISTCFLVDDYYGRLDPPDVVMPRLFAAAEAANLQIDYVARESAAVSADGVELAELVQARLIAEPAPGDNGGRPPTSQTGWLSNGQRSPIPRNDAMRTAMVWKPPRENADNAHSIFMDIELWSDEPSGRRWACPYLAAVWQLLRLGMLRYQGAVVAAPQPVPAVWPQEWSQLPAVMKTNPRAAPFAAYRAVSIMETRFMKIEHAVRTILGAVSHEEAVVTALARRVAGEGLRVPDEITDRLEYVFTSKPWRAG